MKATHTMPCRVLRAFAGITAFTLLFPVLAAAQQQAPLAEVARKEAERRKGIKETQKVITAKDLPESARKPASAPASGHQTEGAPQAAGSAPQAAAGTDSGQKDENYWRTRITAARESLRRNEAFAQALQTRINALTLDLDYRTDRIQRLKVGEDRTKALEELARVRSDVEQSRKQIDEVEEEARKAGVPPGWLR